MNIAHKRLKRGCFRVSLMLIVGWLAITFLTVSQNRHLDWWGSRGPEEGFWIFVVGALAIFVLCNSIPRIAVAFGYQGATSPSRLTGSGQQASNDVPRTETRKERESHGLKHLVFKSNEAAFEYACRFMDCDLAPGKYIVALVQPASVQFGMKVDVARNQDETQTAVLKIASTDGGFLVLAKTVSANASDLKAGDLVAWEAGVYMSDLGKSSDDKRFGWVGLIVAKLEPEWLVNESCWRLAEEM